MSATPAGPSESGGAQCSEVEASEWHRIAEQRRRQLEHLQDQRLYQVAAAALGRGRRTLGRVRRTTGPVRRVSVRILRSLIAVPTRLRGASKEGSLRSAVALLPVPEPGEVRRSDVTVIIVTAVQPRRLDTLLAAVGRIGVQALVVDNGGVAENAGVIAQHPNARRIPLVAAVNYAQANGVALTEVTTPWVLLLNDDVLPLDDRWLDRMLGAADARTVAVGAQLVHGRRGLLGGAAVDGLVQHAGIGLVLDGPLVRAVHLGRGAAPDVRDEVRDVPAATAACLLVRTDALRSVGGMHAGFDYGSEDVDLCLRLVDHGAIRVALGAVLHHEEGASRLVDRHGGDRRARAQRQAANRALLDARHAPPLRRRVIEGVLPSVVDEPTGGTSEPADPSAPPKGPGTSEAVERLVVGVRGRPPAALVAAFRADRSVAITTSGDGAVIVVADPKRVPAAGDPASEVPVLGWLGASDRVARWTRAALERLDALVVVATDDDGRDARVIAELRSVEPTLPVHRITRPDEVREVVRVLLLAPRWTLRIGAPGGRTARRWGDLPVADALREELRAHGLVVRTVTRDRWGHGADRAADVTVHLKGRGVAPVAGLQRNIVWVMSHPSEVAPGELEAADLVIAGSELLAERYRGWGIPRVAVLPQAADARRFVPGPVEPERTSRVLFVGNTRSVPRPSVLGAVDAGLPLTLIGGGWERYVDPRRITLPSVANAVLPGWYRSADVVLNDHWDDMARWGLVSNRVFDVLACGTCIVSDEVPGMAELLDDAVATFVDREDVGRTVRALLADPAERAARAERGRRVVVAAHTWEHRAAELVALVSGLAP